MKISIIQSFLKKKRKQSSPKIVSSLQRCFYCSQLGSSKMQGPGLYTELVLPRPAFLMGSSVYLHGPQFENRWLSPWSIPIQSQSPKDCAWKRRAGLFTKVSLTVISAEETVRKSRTMLVWESMLPIFIYFSHFYFIFHFYWGPHLCQVLRQALELLW